MKMIQASVLLPAILIFAVIPAEGQEDMLQKALKEREGTSSGLTSLADRIQNFEFLEMARGLVEKLEGNDRKVDPFGMAMDPEKAAPEIVPEITAENGEEVQKTTLQEAVSKFKVTGLFPRRQEVIVGARSLKVGDQVVIKHKGVSFRLNIQAVTASEVKLMDLETGEVAGVSLNFMRNLPAGMTRKRLEAADRDGEKNAVATPGTIVPMARNVLVLDGADEQDPGEVINGLKKIR